MQTTNASHGVSDRKRKNAESLSVGSSCSENEKVNLQQTAAKQGRKQRLPGLGKRDRRMAIRVGPGRKNRKTRKIPERLRHPPRGRTDTGDLPEISQGSSDKAKEHRTSLRGSRRDGLLLGDRLVGWLSAGRRRGTGRMRHQAVQQPKQEAGTPSGNGLACSRSTAADISPLPLREFGQTEYDTSRNQKKSRSSIFKFRFNTFEDKNGALSLFR